MRFKEPFFSMINKGETLAVIQAPDKATARARAKLIRHIVMIPDGCTVKRAKRTACRSAVFFEGHFRALEDMFDEAGV
ncbi:MAG: hypothetical protein JWR22_2840 [Herminiimonas sp.]|nr:hypothetical protein [Herminiimonas sp.]